MEGGGAAAPCVTLGVLLFDGFEPLDLAGPINVFGAARGPRHVDVVYVAERAGPVTSVTGAMTLVASYSLADMQPPRGEGGGAATGAAGPALHWLLVPGGIGTRREVANSALLRWIAAWCAPGSGLELCMSVCTGSALLAAAGVLDGRRATSNKLAFDSFVTQVRPQVQWVRRARWVRDGLFATSSGVSAGMDMAVALLKELMGADVAAAAAKYAELLPCTDPDGDPYADEAYVPAV